MEKTLKFDLHQHTTLSDGDMNPEIMFKFVERYKESIFMTVTDHDTFLWHRKYKAYMTGIEISCTAEINGCDTPIDLLLYGFSMNEMEKMLEYRDYNYYPSVKEMSKLTKNQRKNGAKLFLAHPFYCRHFGVQIDGYLNATIKYVDGIECFHNSASIMQVMYLLQVCNDNKKFGSGGSDNHSCTLGKTPYLNLLGEHKNLFSWIHDMNGAGY